MVKKLGRDFMKSKVATLVIVTVVEIIFFYLMNHNYVSWDNIRGIMYSMSLSGTITVGMACLMMSGAIDLASGAEGCISGIIIAILLQAGVHWLLALLIVIAIGGCFGLINAFFANVLNFMPFIATIAMSSVWQGISQAATLNQNIMITNQSFWKLGQINLWIFPLPFVFMVLLLVIYGILISSTRFGRRLMLCGGNRNAARLAGLNYKKLTTIMFINNGCIAAFAGSVLAARMHNGAPSAVVGSEMDGMTAAIIGGVSFLGGGSSGMLVVFIGILMLNCFTNGLYIITLPSYWSVVAKGALLIIALIVDFAREKQRIRSLKSSEQELPA
jgi:ribose transport system permease protein